jgi:hypothetical protein
MNFHASMPPFADFADDHNDNMPSVSNTIDFNDADVLEEEIDENEFYVDYLAGLQLNQNGSKSLLYKYTGYEEIEPGESENGEYDAAEFVSLLYLYLKTVNQPRVRTKKNVIIYQVYREPMTSDFIARLTDGQNIVASKLQKRLIDNFVASCGYEPTQFVHKKIQK